MKTTEPTQNASGQDGSDQTTLLSIVVPLRNCTPSIQIMARILDAIIDVPKEVLVVYDDPNDTSIPVIKQLRERYPALRGIHNDVARGLRPALEAGIRSARGRYILIYASDEIGPVLAIERMLKLMD